MRRNAILASIFALCFSCCIGAGAAYAQDTHTVALFKDTEWTVMEGASVNPAGQYIYTVADLKAAVQRDGVYLLCNDLTLDRDDLPFGGSLEVSKNVGICLNGCELRFDGTYSGSLFTVESGGTLTIGRSLTDSEGCITETVVDPTDQDLYQYAGAVVVNQGGTFILNAIIDGTVGSYYEKDEFLDPVISGGAITVRVKGTCIIQDGVIRNCVGGYGGAIKLEGGSLDFQSGEISDCQAIRYTAEDGTVFYTYGGAIYSETSQMSYGTGGTVKLGPDVTIKECKASCGSALSLDDRFGTTDNAASIEKCHAMDSGTVALRSGSLVNSGDITDCTAEQEGAALLVSKYDSFSVGSPSATITGGTITGNTSNAGLGVVVAGLGGKLTMESGTVANNTCVTEGEAVRVKEGGTFTMNDGNITGGELSGWGSCVRVFEGGTFTMNSGELTGSNCNYGGCVFTSGATTINNASLKGSTVSKGGVIYVEDGTLTIGDKGSVTMTGGHAAESALENGLGGGLYVESGQVTLGEFATITECTAGTDGGGLFVENAEVRLNGAAISNCTAGDCGGGVFTQGGMLSLNNASITGNTADYAGGGLCLSPTKARITGELIGQDIFARNDAEEGIDIFMDYEGMLLDDPETVSGAYFVTLEDLGDGPISVAADENYIVDEGAKMFASTGYDDLDVFEVESDEYEMVQEYGKLFLNVPGGTIEPKDRPVDPTDVDPADPDPNNGIPNTGDHLKGYLIGSAALIAVGGIGLVLARRKMKKGQQKRRVAI